MFLLLKELLQPDGLPAPTHPLGRGVFNETPSRYTQEKSLDQDWGSYIIFKEICIARFFKMVHNCYCFVPKSSQQKIIIDSE